MMSTTAVRFPVANLSALFLMACLFAALYSVTARHPMPAPIHEPTIVHLTPLIRPTEPPPREHPNPPPRNLLPQIPTLVIGDGVPDIIPVVINNVPPDLVVPSSHRQIDSAEAPLVRINPDYPRRAIAGHIQGWVQVRFTITPAGSVSDVAVVDADPKGVFDDAASKAVLRWKYAPRVEDGRAVERRGVQVVLRFNLD